MKERVKKIEPKEASRENINRYGLTQNWGGGTPGLTTLYSPQMETGGTYGTSIRDIADMLAAMGKLTNDQLSQVRGAQLKNVDADTAEILLQFGFVNNEDILAARARIYGFEFRHIKPEQIDKDAFAKLDGSFIINNKIIPVTLEGNVLTVATASPENVFVLDEVKRQTGLDIHVIVSDIGDIEKAIASLSGREFDYDVENLMHDIAEVEVVEQVPDKIEDLEKMACESPVIKFVNYLISHAIRQLAADCSAMSLHQATNADARDMVKLMLAHGANVNQKVAGRTPLHVMAGPFNNRNMVELLLAHGAEVNAKDNTGATPLWHAKVHGNTGIADVLTRHGAIEQSPQVSLHTAARDGDLELLKSLISKGGDVNAQSDRWGGTPLHLAATSGHRNVIEFLIASGANVNAQNRYGRTPLDDVMDRGQTEIVEMLRKAGAKGGTPVAPQMSRPGPSFFERAVGQFAIPDENLRIPDEMQSCAANLKRIHAAIKQYEKDKGGLPYWLSDLVPGYLPQKALLCPDHPEHRAVFMYFEPQIPMEPRLPCSYVYEFSMARLPTQSPGSPTGRMITRDRKTAQVRLFGDVVPLVRCRAQSVILNLAVNGQVYVSPMVWEKVFIPDYTAGQELAEETSP